ncbi:MAG TPA: sugar ABC transporter permease [Candidatus Fimimorpha excrementavium]|nr:sugar ABC transporter permease [Candidatus Fimimorpha excrementavium]
MPPQKSFGARLRRDMYMNKWKYILIIPVVLYFALFCYKPMYGILIAFKDYKPRLGVAESPWVGMKYFEMFINDIKFWTVLRNTFSISALTIIFGFPAPIILALLLNEIKSSKFKRTVQTITYLPHFISVVIVCGMLKEFCMSEGLFSSIAQFFGGEKQNFLQNADVFYPIYVLSDIWQGIGWNSIIYLAALSGIDQEQFEAARIDGAGRFARMIHITLPGIMPTIMILFILRMGSILNVGHEKILLLYNPTIYSKADVISTYVYRTGLESAQYSYSTAINLFNSLVNLVFLLLTNYISKRFTENSFL